VVSYVSIIYTFKISSNVQLHVQFARYKIVIILNLTCSIFPFKKPTVKISPSNLKVLLYQMTNWRCLVTSRTNWGSSMYHFAMSLVGEFLVNKGRKFMNNFSQVLHVKKAPLQVVVRSPNLFMNILKYCEKIICISI